jgi:hypothetical protein
MHDILETMTDIGEEESPKVSSYLFVILIHIKLRNIICPQSCPQNLMIDSSGPVDFSWVVGGDNNSILSAINPLFLTKKEILLSFGLLCGQAALFFILDLPGRVVAETDPLTQPAGEIRKSHDDLPPLLHQHLALLMGKLQ